MDAGGLSCARCEYDLRMLDPAGVCPECALPIAQSVFVATEPMAPVRVSLRWATGILLLAVALRIACALTLAWHMASLGRGEFVVSTLTGLLGPWPIDRTTDVLDVMPRSTAGFWWGTCLIVPLIVQCIGMWLFTRDVAPRGIPIGFRRLARWTFVGAVALVAIMQITARWNLLNPGALDNRGTAFWLIVVPPVALVVWTTTIWSRLAREPRGGYAAWAFVIAAALYGWWQPDSATSQRPFGLLVGFAAQWSLALMWYDLWMISGRVGRYKMT